jgi:hypothetical protein
MKKTMLNKISLTKETLRTLNDSAIQNIAGGAITRVVATCNASCVTDISCGPSCRLTACCP